MTNSPGSTVNASATRVALRGVVVGEADVVTVGGWEQSQPPNTCADFSSQSRNGANYCHNEKECQRIEKNLLGPNG